MGYKLYRVAGYDTIPLTNPFLNLIDEIVTVNNTKPLMNILILGSTGLVGSEIIRQLQNSSHSLTLFTHQKAFEELDNITYIQGDVLSLSDLEKATQNIDIIINSIGIIQEKPPQQTFENIHIQSVQNIISAMHKNHISKLIHISALGTESMSNVKYFRTKYAAEAIIKSSNIDYIILRPSIVWHTGYGFEKNLQSITHFPLFSPIPGDGSYLFQPVAVQDIGNIITQLVIENTFSACKNTTYDITGPQKITLKDMILFMERYYHKKKIHIFIPLIFLQIIASIAAFCHIPSLITKDQISMMKRGNISSDHRIFEILNIKRTVNFENIRPGDPRLNRG